MQFVSWSFRLFELWIYLLPWILGRLHIQLFSLHGHAARHAALQPLWIVYIYKQQLHTNLLPTTAAGFSPVFLSGWLPFPPLSFSLSGYTQLQQRSFVGQTLETRVAFAHGSTVLLLCEMPVNHGQAAHRTTSALGTGTAVFCMCTPSTACMD